MSVKQLKSTIWWLAKSQWFYGRLQCALNENKSRGKLSKLTKELNIREAVDLVIFLEL